MTEWHRKAGTAARAGFDVAIGPREAGLTSRGGHAWSIASDGRDIAAWKRYRSRSYTVRKSGSLMTLRTTLTTCISSVARQDSFRSGWKVRARRRQAALISSVEAEGGTPRRR